MNEPKLTVGILFAPKIEFELQISGNIHYMVNNLISKEGLYKILLLMVENYVTFAPLGIVMVAMLGIGLAENSGLIKAAINSILVRAPKKLITFL